MPKTFYCNNIDTSLNVSAPAGSYLQLTLNQNASAGSGVVTQAPICIPIVSGSFSQTIWFNDEIYPSGGTYYNVQIISPNAAGVPTIVYNQNIPITGASYNLATWIPVAQGSVPSSNASVPIFETNGVQNTVQSTLNLQAGNTGVTLTSDSSGDVSISPLEQKAQVTVSSAQLLALETTPVTIVAAQGAGTVIIPVSNPVFVYKPNTTPYTLTIAPSYQLVYDWRSNLPTQNLTGEVGIHTAVTGSTLGLNTLNRTYTQSALAVFGTTMVSPLLENTALVLTNVATGSGGAVNTWSLLSNGATCTFGIAEAGNGYAVNDVFSVTSVGTNGAQIHFTVTGVNASGGVTSFTLLSTYRSDGQWFTKSYVKATLVSPSVGQGLYINVTASGGSGQNGITGYTINAGGSGYNVGDTGSVTANNTGGGSTTAKYTVSSVNSGAVTGLTITSVGGGFSSSTTCNTTKITGSGTGMTLNVTATGGGYAVNDTGTWGNGTYTVSSVDSNGNVTGLTINTSPTNVSRGANILTASTGIGFGLNLLVSNISCDATAGDGTLEIYFDYIVLTA